MVDNKKDEYIRGIVTIFLGTFLYFVGNYSSWYDWLSSDLRNILVIAGIIIVIVGVIICFETSFKKMKL